MSVVRGNANGDEERDAARADLLPTTVCLESTAYNASRHPARSYLARLAPTGRRAQRSALEAIARWASSGKVSWNTFPWEQLRYQHTAAIRAWLIQTRSPATTRRMLCGLRGVLKECWRLGLVETDAYARASDLERVPGKRLPAGRSVSPGEVRRLFEVLADDGRAIARRDAALLALLFGGGLRRSELAALELRDVDLQTGELRITEAKGRRDRISWLAPSGLPALRDWLAIRGDDPGPLLWPVRKGGQLQPRRMSMEAIRDVCERRAGECDLQAISPHDCRRTWVGDLLDAGADLALAQGLAGHASAATTAAYDRRPEAARQRAAALLHVPYRAPKVR